MFASIAAFLVKIFGKNLDFLTGMFSRRVAMVTASLTMMGVLIAVLFAVVANLLNLIAYITPSSINIVMSWIIPSNLNGVITAYLAFRVALALYKFQLVQIKQITGGA
ncbi:MAG TPA: DUF5455 family protein [Psychromonas sp.]